MIVSGSVKFFNEERGYGFVLPDQPLGDAFFHIASLRKMGIPRVIPGQRAVFEISIAPGRGLRVERFFLIHSGAPEQCALEAELLNSRRRCAVRLRCRTLLRWKPRPWQSPNRLHKILSVPRNCSQELF